jgi:hypothetical protein
MSHDRFLAVLTMLHLNNDAKAARAEPDYDPLFKIRPIIDTLITLFQDVYSPGRTADYRRGNMPISRPYIFFCVYIKGKPHKYGIKMFELCEAKRSTTWKHIQGHIPPTQNTTQRCVVDRLCDKIKGRGHSVYMDRWFSSPKIFDHLWSCKKKAVGIVMSNRKEMSKQAFSVKLKKGEKIASQRDHLLAIKWKDTRDVFSLTSDHEDEVVEAPSSMGAHHKIQPTTVFDYNKYKTGVDRSEQLLSYYRIFSNLMRTLFTVLEG